MATTKTGWEPEKRTHFDEIVTNYDKIRPNYPDKLFANLIEYAGLGINKKALEIGAGTGKATRPILEAGYNVTAVEIGANMAAFLSDKYKGYKNFNVIVSAFEDADLQENAYDLIYAASSIHWVDAKIGCPKIKRLLKNGGTVALLRYNFSSESDEILDAAYEKYFRTHYLSSQRYGKATVKRTHDDLRNPAGFLARYGFNGLEEYEFKDITLNFYDVEIIYTADEYIELYETMADHRDLPEKNKTALYSEITKLINQNGGKYKMDYIFQVYMGRK
jgi:ubiquinone/menaquinone biosynthesis C-methylase UbiE